MKQRGSAEAQEVIRQLEGLSRNFQKRVDRLSLTGNMPPGVTKEEAESRHIRKVEIEAAASTLAMRIGRPQSDVASALRIAVEKEMLPGTVTFADALDKATATVLEKVRATGRL